MTAPADRRFPGGPGDSYPDAPGGTYPDTPGGTYPDAPGDSAADHSVGELIGNISNDLSQLFRQEVELAKAEVKVEAAKAGKAAGMLGVAGFAGYLAVVLLSFAAVFGLANVMDAGWAALIVAVIWAIIGAILYVRGRSKLKTVDPMPRRTVDTIKEDAQWLKNPTG